MIGNILLILLVPVLTILNFKDLIIFNYLLESLVFRVGENVSDKIKEFLLVSWCSEGLGIVMIHDQLVEIRIAE